MDFKKLIMNNKAVSPVIGVILMVAITVILAAAIGSAVFGQGTAQSAPQTNLDIKSASTTTATPAPVSVKIEHLGGDSIHFETDKQTKVMASLEGADAVEIGATSLNTMSVGDVKTLPLTAMDSTKTPNVKSGDTVNIKFIDVATSQLICDKDVRF
ncbi:type IV pilin [Methanosarcina sp.]|uniref:type IV pilin n=1 Tax=Methanosarcina sp. TaxID=2213 RepID=UPI003C737B0B